MWTDAKDRLLPQPEQQVRRRSQVWCPHMTGPQPMFVPFNTDIWYLPKKTGSLQFCLFFREFEALMSAAHMDFVPNGLGRTATREFSMTHVALLIHSHCLSPVTLVLFGFPWRANAFLYICTFMFCPDRIRFHLHFKKSHCPFVLPLPVPSASRTPT